jgi:hypothetical protein
MSGFIKVVCSAMIMFSVSFGGLFCEIPSFSLSSLNDTGGKLRQIPTKSTADAITIHIDNVTITNSVVIMQPSLNGSGNVLKLFMSALLIFLSKHWPWTVILPFRI